MAMVLSQKTKMVFGGLLTFMLLGCVLVTGSALGWFSPGGSSEMSGELAAKLSQRKHYGLQGSFQELKLFGNPSQAEVQCADSKSLAGSIGLEDDDLLLYENKNFGSGSHSDDEDLYDIDNDKDDKYYEGSGREELFTSPPPMIPPFPGMMKGEKGDKGQKGSHGETVRGADGPPGKPGPPGPPGPPGIPGSGIPMSFASEFSNGDGGSGDDRIVGEGFIPTGKCSCNITEIMKSFTMPETLQGPQGPPGADGRTGSPGLTGQPGVPGERGPSGPRGERGERGDQGTPGPEGPIGPKGQPGLDGRPGVPGAPGPPGPPAPVDHTIGDESVFGSGFDSGVRRPGTPGPKGEPGPLGPQGVQGEKGFTGHKGERGDLGPKGHKGERGHQGPMGLSGMKGERGPSGLDGLPGQPGANGRPADKGEKGERGPEGKPGPPGPPGPISVKYTSDEGEMFDPGLSSPPGTFVGGSIGPEGPKGEQGPVGPKGEKGGGGIDGVPGFPGTDGKSGERGQIGPSGLPGMEGPQGPPGTKGERGERGPPGPVSTSGGNSDFVAIKGEKGDMGQRGRRGKPGVSGPTGPPGKPGTPGGVGAPGWIGRPGFSGMPGVPGTKGEKGDSGSSSMFGYGSGQKGDKGDRGNDGIPGSPGTDGVDGRPGPPGLPGPPSSSASGVSEDGAVHFVPVPGPPGPPGPPGIPGLSVTGPKGEPGMFKSPVYGDTSYNARQTAKSPLDELKALKDQKDLKNFRDSVTNEPPYYARRSTPSPDDDSTKIVPGAVTFQNTETMKKMSTSSPVGTLAYIIDEEALLVRVTNGWQYIALGSVLPITSQAPPTTTPPQARPPFEASNLINNVPVPVEGPKLRMAALNVPMTGDMHGVRGADYDCYRQARRAGLRGTFRAFLSSRVQNIDSIVRWADRDLPVVNTRGDVLFNSWGELFDGAGGIFAQSPRIYSFNGKNILTDDSWPQKVVWHGSNPQGERMMDTYCDAWHSSSSDKVGLASSLMGHKLLSQERHPCNSQFALLCIEATSQTSQRRRRDLNKFNETNFDDLLSPDDYQDYLQELQSENSN